MKQERRIALISVGVLLIFGGAALLWPYHSMAAWLQVTFGCLMDQSPQFRYGFAFLKDQLGETMGDPGSCEYADGQGNTYQMTTTGHAFYLKQTNTPAFVRGNQYWAWTAVGLVHTTPPAAASITFIPAGPFEMGSARSDPDEQPAHIVMLSAFYINRYKVTNAEFRQCVAAGACHTPQTCVYGALPDTAKAQADHPVVCVSFDEAQTYCQWWGGRLPTEAEWEKAARGTDSRPYPWGGQAPRAELLNYNGNIGGTTPVGSYPEGMSPYGLYDMAGNVWEWVADWYSPNYYPRSPAVNPAGPDSGDYRVLRSGAFNDDSTHIRATNRNRNLPDGTADSLGFRCVRPI